jgi:hypothetical protein
MALLQKRLAQREAGWAAYRLHDSRRLGGTKRLMGGRDSWFPVRRRFLDAERTMQNQRLSPNVASQSNRQACHTEASLSHKCRASSEPAKRFLSPSVSSVCNVAVCYPRRRWDRGPTLGRICTYQYTPSAGGRGRGDTAYLRRGQQLSWQSHSKGKTPQNGMYPAACVCVCVCVCVRKREIERERERERENEGEKRLFALLSYCWPQPGRRTAQRTAAWPSYGTRRLQRFRASHKS